MNEEFELVGGDPLIAPEDSGPGHGLDAAPAEETEDFAVGASCARPRAKEGVGPCGAPVGSDPLIAPPGQAASTDSGPSGGPAPAQQIPDLRSHFASLCAEGAAMEREIPGFSLESALRDPDFLRLTSPAVGVSARAAWYALHGAEREAAAARAAEESLARRVAANAARPREGGRGAAAGALCAAALDRESRAALRRRVYEAAARGEKVYP